MKNIAISGIVLLSCICCVWTASNIDSKRCGTAIPYATLPEGYCAFIWARGLGTPRGIITAANGDVIVVDQSAARILVLWENSVGEVEHAVLSSGNGLNHAVVIHEKFLYASSSTTVYRWPYVEGIRTNLGPSEVVVKNVPCCGHSTRSLAFDQQGLLYVQSGSSSNVDADSSHSQIRRFRITELNTDWLNGELFADGLRNEVGIRFDKNWNLWGVENGCDNLNRADLGGDIHHNNPSEEVNLVRVCATLTTVSSLQSCHLVSIGDRLQFCHDFKSSGLFYGYPYCWSQFNLPENGSNPIGTQWAHPNFINDGTHSDAWCRELGHVVPPAFNLPAHTAPLDILFYYGSHFPSIAGDAFVALHGSWNRSPAAGYRVIHLKFENGLPVSASPFLSYVGPGETGPNWPHRPVALTLSKCAGNDECLLVTDNGTGSIIAITRDS